ncbi:MAG: peptidyl-prolyl cis-trans isomerase C [Bacillariaceae sp.]|jgi:peptidyl-prolyl cis-trans isomerase C
MKTQYKHRLPKEKMFNQRNIPLITSIFLGSIFILLFSNASAFLPSIQSITTIHSGVGKSSRIVSSSLNMGMFDGFSKAFSNEEYGAPPDAVKATARHILVQSEGEAKVIMKMISSGEETFESCAKDYSTCPSGKQGGSLGSFPPGRMVPEFDKVIFNPNAKIGQLVGPVLTEFGHHIIVLDKRTGGGDWF